MPTRVWSCCGTTYTHSDTVGCCSACGQVFSGLAAFQQHQSGPRDERGHLQCRDPKSVTRKDGNPIFEAHPNSHGPKPLWRLWETDARRAQGRVYVQSHRPAHAQAGTQQPDAP